MSSTLSTRQRTTLVSALLVAGEASVVAGIFMGWSAAVVIGASAACLVTAILVILTGSAAIQSFLAGLGAHTQRMAEGDLTQDISAQGSYECSEALHSLQALQVALRKTLGSIRGGADGVSVAAHEIATGNTDLSNRTEQTATNLQRAASSMAQLTGTVNQTAESARTANQLASSASEVAARGGNVVAQVVSTMNEINTASKKIADIIGTIDGIAFQTNILALNAAVEAARAGEQGRGFAVVAAEVQTLAQQSASASEAIGRVAEDQHTEITNVIAALDRASAAVREAAEAQATVAAATEEQTATLSQVTDSITGSALASTRIADQMSRVETVAFGTAGTVGQLRQAAEDFDAVAQALSDQVGAFTLN